MLTGDPAFCTMLVTASANTTAPGVPMSMGRFKTTAVPAVAGVKKRKGVRMSNTPNPKVSAMLGFLSNLDLSMPAVGVAVLALKWEELLVPAAVLVGGAVSVALVNAGYGAVLSYQEQTETNELEEMYALPSSDDDDGDEEKAL